MKFVNPLTTAEPVGVATRDLILSSGSIIAVLGILGMLSAEQTTALRDLLPEIAVAAPAAVTAIGTIMGLGISIYRILAKSMSDRGEEVAKETDAQIPASQSVVIETPVGQDNIVVPPTKV